MHIRSLLYFACAAGLIAPLPAASEESPIIVAPATPWQVDFAAARCRATRLFGEDDAQTILLLEQITPADSIRWVLAGQVAKELNSGRDLTVQFGPGYNAWEMRPEKRTTLGDFGPAFRGSSLREPDIGFKEKRSNDDVESAESKPHTGLTLLDPEEGSAIEWLELSRGKHRPRRLATGSMGQLFEILNTCMTDLLTSWGVDVEAHARLAKAPRPLNLQRIAKLIQEHYPSRALNWGKQADLNVRMLVDKNGDVTRCQITHITKAEDFDNKACAEFSKVAEFEPAYDIDGQPMDSYYATVVSYRLN